MNDGLRLLLVEDDELDAELVVRHLKDAGFAIDWERVDTEATLLHALERPWDVILSDFAMPAFSGLAAFELVTQHGSDVPFIFVSGALGEERAVEAMRAGAKDYFLKGNLTRLPEAIRREVAQARSRRDRKIAEEAVRREQERLTLAIEASGTGVFEVKLNDAASAVNYAGVWSHLLGYANDELPKNLPALAEWFDVHVHPDDRRATFDGIHSFHAGVDDRHESEFRLLHRSGKWVHVAVFAQIVDRRPDGSPVRIAGVLLDLSARKHLEAQLRQAQKMEAVGQLASGVAHDFNNLLTAILSFATFAFEEAQPGAPIADDIQEVLKAARRAQSVTSQLLALSSRKVLASRVVEVAQVVRGIERILRRLMGEDIDITVRSEAKGSAKVDPDAIGQVLLNLAVNARDAMPRGGKFTVELLDVALSAEEAARKAEHVAPGDYVLMVVSDSGTGMEASTLARIFEPFFTTKEVGRGTGLGLSMCHDIVKQADGIIEVESQLGGGTTFRVYLPRVAGVMDEYEKQLDSAELRGVENVLVAEDDEQVRALARRALSRAGYKVVEVDNGQDALDEMKRPGARFDLLLTNLVMPIMSGPELVGAVRALYPWLRVLIMSGHNAAALVQRSLPSADTSVLQKPFTPDELARKVRWVLDGPAATAREAT